MRLTREDVARALVYPEGVRLKPAFEHNADELLGAEVILASEAEAVRELCDDVERLLARDGA